MHLSGRITVNAVADGTPDAPIYTTMENLTVALDFGRAEIASEEHDYGIYSTRNLRIIGDGMLTVSKATKEGLHVGGTLTLDDPAYTPVVSAYARQYAVRTGSLDLREGELNAIVLTADHTAGDDAAVANAAILTGNLTVGTTSDLVSENNVTVFASCDVSGGYGVYAKNSAQILSSYVDVIKPVDYSWSSGNHYVKDGSGDPARVVRIATKLYYGIEVDEGVEHGDLELLDHTDRRAFAGTTVNFRVAPDECYRLSGVDLYYADDNYATPHPLSGNSFVMPATDVYLTTSFYCYGHTITVNVTGRGSAVPNKDVAAAGATVALEVQPNNGWILGSLYAYDSQMNEISISQVNTFEMPDDDVTVEAVFTHVSHSYGTPAWTWTVPDASATFTCTVCGHQETVGATVTAEELPEKTTYTATVVFQNGTYTDTKDAAPIDYTVTVLSTENGTVSVSGDPTRAHVGDTITLTDSPATGYVLQGYTVTDANDQTVALVTANTFVMPACNVTVEATFVQKDYRVQIVGVTGGAASADPETAHMGDTVTLTAQPAAGYRLDSFIVTDENSQTVAPATENTFVMPASDVTVTPIFTAIDYTIAVLPTDNGTVTVSKSVANVDDEITFTVSPAEGYVLQKLTVFDFSYNSYAVSENKLVMPAANLIVVASFTRAPCRITVVPAAHGTVTASLEAADAGTRITLTINPEDGYTLSRLTVTDADGQAIPVQNNQFLMPASNVTVAASFFSAELSKAYFVGNSLTLEGEIGVNFYVKLNDVDPANARVEFIWGSGSRAGSKTVALRPLTTDANDRYQLTVCVAAAQMTDSIRASLYDGETLVAEQQYSVAQYARYVIGADDETLLPLVDHVAEKVPKLRELCTSMLIYGAKSQQQFRYNTYALADQGLVYTLEAVGTLGTKTFPENFVTTCSIQYVGSSLILDSKTTYRLYFTVKNQDTFNNLTVKLGEDTLQYGTKDGKIYFEIANLAAAEVFRDYTLRFGSTDVTVNAGTYVTGVHGGSDPMLKAVVCALYRYSTDAKTFFGVQ